MNKGYILSIDRGQSKIKAALCDWKADVVNLVSCSCEPIQTPKAGWAQQDMKLMWVQTVELIRKLLQQSDIQPEKLSAVSFSGQGGGNFLIDESGNPVYPGVLSMDSRHEDVQAQMNGENIPRTIAFMRWLKEFEPEVYQRTRWILGSKDWLRFCLTGKANADMSDTPAPADYHEMSYRTECLEKAGVPECIKMLPPLVYASQICGYVTQQASELTGIPQGTPVVAGAHDMIACSLGTGGNHNGHLAVILGTLGINIATVRADQDVREELSLKIGREKPGEIFSFGGATKKVWNITTSIGSGCNTMNWTLDLLYKAEMKKLRRRGEDIFHYIEGKLCGKEPVRLIAQPYLMGTFYNSHAKAGILGITAATTKEDMILALYQGICISMCIEIEKIEKIQNLSDIWLTGGGSKSRIWPQMFADVLQRPVQIAKCDEPGCRGAALCAGIALGWYSLENLPELEKDAVYCPEKRLAAFYEQQKAIYKKVYKITSELWLN